MGLFENRNNKIPVWFMRQAGRYHSHYQTLRAKHGFMELCKNPELACEVTMGPVNEFKFDAAILFSDILFPLEQLGMGLSYEEGPPSLKFKLHHLSDFEKISITKEAEIFYRFQQDALKLLNKRLSPETTLLGFVGAPFTLFCYATIGSHSGALVDPKLGLTDGRYDKFLEILVPQLLKNMYMQAENSDAVCLFDTAAGELCLSDFKEFILPTLKQITATFKHKYKNKKVVYYSKLTHLHYLKEIQDDNIDVLAIDWRLDLNRCLKELGNDYFIQGNIDPSWMFLPWDRLQQNLDTYWKQISNNPNLSKWICNLGHGVMPKTPENNILNTVNFIHSTFKL